MSSDSAQGFVLVASADYIARQTGTDASEVVLLRTSGDTAAIAAAARKFAATQGGTKVTTLGETQALISSSLTAVDLRGLTALELAFSVLMIAGVTGLVLALDLPSAGAASLFYRRLARRQTTWRLSLGRGALHRG